VLFRSGKKALERNELRKLEREGARQLEKAFELEQPKKVVKTQSVGVQEDKPTVSSFTQLFKPSALYKSPVLSKPKAPIEFRQLKPRKLRELQEPKLSKDELSITALELRLQLQDERFLELEKARFTEDEVLALVISLLELK